MSYKVGRVLPARRRSACLRPRVQGARFGRRPASDRCKHVSEGIRLSGRRGLADSPSKPLRRWKVTSWTLAIILSLVIITIAFSQEEKRLPEYHPRSRKILAHDESSSSMESQAMRRNNTEERRESVLAADHYASSTAVIAGGHVEDLQNRHKRSPGRSHRRMKRPRRKRKRLRNKVNLVCHINSQRVKVVNLGLGYDSEEVVKFNYCSGSCAHLQTNYDLVLSNLVRIRKINKNEIQSLSPCCGPSMYDDVSFQDVRGIWHVLSNFSAVDCKCL